MRILILQLARLGDIYLSWPAIRALRRKYPNAQIDIMVRHRFRAACQGLTEVNTVWCFSTKDLLAPVLEDFEIRGSLKQISQLQRQIQAQNYNVIFNLSYSPLSSYLTRSMAFESTQVRGYSRSDDGYLAIPDDPSAYFFAQAGIARANRIHLSEIFAQVLEVELDKADWRSPEFDNSFPVNSPFIVVHVGASQSEKSYWPEKWNAVLRQLLRAWNGQIVMIGTAAEAEYAQVAASGLDSQRLINLVGKTKSFDLFAILSASELVVGADSAPMHIASLTGSKCLNLSFGSVNLWETGPQSPGSRILWAFDPGGLASDFVVGEVISALENTATEAIEVTGYTPTYSSSQPEPFQWQLIKALYLGDPYPYAPEIIVQGLAKIQELSDLALMQLDQIQKDPEKRTHYSILERVDETLELMTKVVPDLTPLIRWYQTEKIRLGPMPVAELVSATRNIHQQLSDFIEIWIRSQASEVQDGVTA